MATDSSAIDAAIVAALQADASLASLMPDGVYMDIAPPGLQRYVIVSLVIAEDRATFEGRAIEDCLYLVKAVMLTTTSTTGIREAAARIETDSTIRWQHRGGRYRVQMTPTTSTLH
jgi:hypothetical protein